MALRNKVLLAALAALGACGPLVDIGGQSGPPPRIYDIKGPESVAQIAQISAPAIILIEEPFTSGILDSDRIAIVLEGGEIQFLSGARWSDRPVRMTRRALQDSLKAVSGLTPLARGTLDIPNDYRLKVQLRDFHVDGRGGLPASSVALQAWLVDTTGTLVATQSFESASDLGVLEPANAVRGIQADLTDVAEQMTRWIASELESRR